MPKKFHGENTKAAVARARKQDAAKQEEEQRSQAIDDALWADDDKHLQRKQQRKEDRMKKKQETVEKKAILRTLEEDELNSIKGAAKVAAVKLTRADIAAATELHEKSTSKGQKREPPEIPLELNVNRVEVEGIEARNVDDAIAALSVMEVELDRHPERRMKAAYQAFEDANLPRLKAENSNMRLSQLKQLLKKDWMKSPENPLNQKSKAYNAK